MYKVIDLDWTSESAKEAELTLYDGTFKVLAYTHPCGISKHQVIDDLLHAEFVDNLCVSYENNPQIQNLGGYKHFCRGVLVDRKENLVKIGEFLIQTDEDMPGGLTDGDYVEFTALRIDVW